MMAMLGKALGESGYAHSPPVTRPHGGHVVGPPPTFTSGSTSWSLLRTGPTAGLASPRNTALTSNPERYHDAGGNGIKSPMDALADAARRGRSTVSGASPHSRAIACSRHQLRHYSKTDITQEYRRHQKGYLVGNSGRRSASSTPIRRLDRQD